MLESLPVARGSFSGGVRSQASLMQKVDMVMSRKRKMSLAGITARIQTRKEQKQELKEVERLSRSKEVS